MKPMTNLQDLLHIYLNDLYNSELELQKTLAENLVIAKSDNLKMEIEEYLQSCKHKIDNLERINHELPAQFNNGNGKILNSIIEESNELITSTSQEPLKDAVLLTSIQTINNFKIGRYRTSWAIAHHLQMDQILSELAMLQAMEETTREILRWLANKQLFKEAIELQTLKTD
jgi:ferritin-like metal-binding protein YciE